MYDALLQILQKSPIVRDPHIDDLRPYGENAFRVKLRATVTANLTLQVWINHNSRRTRYTYQLFTSGTALLRWDNAPHYPRIRTNFPHHFHDDRGQITASPLQSDPLQDLPTVLEKIEQYLSREERPDL